MQKNKITMIKETFQNEQTGELAPAVTIILDGSMGKMLEIIMEKQGYTDYTEALRDIIFDGVHSIIKENS